AAWNDPEKVGQDVWAAQVAWPGQQVPEIELQGRDPRSRRRPRVRIDEQVEHILRLEVRRHPDFVRTRDRIGRRVWIAVPASCAEEATRNETPHLDTHWNMGAAAVEPRTTIVASSKRRSESDRLLTKPAPAER